MSENSRAAGISRRRLLAGAGTAGAGLAAASAGILPGIRPAAARAAVTEAGAAGHGLPPGAPASSMLFGRIFPQLPPFAPVTDAVQAALLEAGAQGGILDAQDDLAAGPKALIVDPTVNGNPTATNPYGTNPDNPTMTAGSTFVGQFTDHDITFDQTSQLGVTTNPLTSPNTRTPGTGPGLGVRRRVKRVGEPVCVIPTHRLLGKRADAEDAVHDALLHRLHPAAPIPKHSRRCPRPAAVPLALLNL